MKFLEPCIPSMRSEPPTGDTWLHEIKIDGWRCQLVKEGRRICLFSRRGNHLTERVGSFAQNFQELDCKSARIDGELTVADQTGRPDFYALSGAMRRRPRDLMLVAFDLLELDGRDFRGEPLEARREALSDLLVRSGIGCACFSEAFTDAQALLQACAELGLEGIVSKRRDLPYRGGKRLEWVKVKTAEWKEANSERWKHFSAPRRTLGSEAPR
jgi:bifunctional non-homologous end joining protein LigD